jgi:hypothetical protein
MPRFALAVLVAATALIATSGATAAVLVNERTTYDAILQTCNLELVTGQWTVHDLYWEQVGPDGETRVFALQTTTFTGTDAAGNTYVAPSHQTFLSFGDPANPTIHTETFTWNIVKTGQGTAPEDLQIRAVFHFTFDANGHLTNFKYELYDECR